VTVTTSLNKPHLRKMILMKLIIEVKKFLYRSLSWVSCICYTFSHRSSVAATCNFVRRELQQSRNSQEQLSINVVQKLSSYGWS